MQDDSMFKEGSILLDYLPKLIRLAEKNMSSRIQQKIGADDMADSIIASVVRAWKNGKLRIDIEDSQDFWRYLVAISLNKIRKKVRLLNTDKRKLDLEVPLHNIEFLVVQQGDPSQEAGETVALLLERLQEELDEDKLIVLRGKLEGQAAEEIAEQLNGGKGMSTKTVARHWKAIENQLKQLVEEMELL